MMLNAAIGCLIVLLSIISITDAYSVSIFSVGSTCYKSGASINVTYAIPNGVTTGTERIAIYKQGVCNDVICPTTDILTYSTLSSGRTSGSIIFKTDVSASSGVYNAYFLTREVGATAATTINSVSSLFTIHFSGDCSQPIVKPVYSVSIPATCYKPGAAINVSFSVTGHVIDNWDRVTVYKAGSCSSTNCVENAYIVASYVGTIDEGKQSAWKILTLSSTIKIGGLYTVYYLLEDKNNLNLNTIIAAKSFNFSISADGDCSKPYVAPTYTLSVEKQCYKSGDSVNVSYSLTNDITDGTERIAIYKQGVCTATQCPTSNIAAYATLTSSKTAGSVVMKTDISTLSGYYNAYFLLKEPGQFYATNIVSTTSLFTIHISGDCSQPIVTPVYSVSIPSTCYAYGASLNVSFSVTGHVIDNWDRVTVYKAGSCSSSRCVESDFEVASYIGTTDEGKQSSYMILPLTSMKAGIYTVYYLLEDKNDGNLNTIVAAKSANFTLSYDGDCSKPILPPAYTVSVASSCYKAGSAINISYTVSNYITDRWDRVGVYKQGSCSSTRCSSTQYEVASYFTNTGEAGKTSGYKVLTLPSSMTAGSYMVYFLLEDPSNGNLNTIVAANSLNFSVITTGYCPGSAPPPPSSYSLSVDATCLKSGATVTVTYNIKDNLVSQQYDRIALFRSHLCNDVYCPSSGYISAVYTGFGIKSGVKTFNPVVSGGLYGSYTAFYLLEDPSNNNYNTKVVAKSANFTIHPTGDCSAPISPPVYTLSVEKQCYKSGSSVNISYAVANDVTDGWEEIAIYKQGVCTATKCPIDNFLAYTTISSGKSSGFVVLKTDAATLSGVYNAFFLAKATGDTYAATIKYTSSLFVIHFTGDCSQPIAPPVYTVSIPQPATCFQPGTALNVSFSVTNHVIDNWDRVTIYKVGACSSTKCSSTGYDVASYVGTVDEGKQSAYKILTLPTGIKPTQYKVYYLLEDKNDGNLNTIIAASTPSFLIPYNGDCSKPYVAPAYTVSVDASCYKAGSAVTVSYTVSNYISDKWDRVGVYKAGSCSSTKCSSTTYEVASYFTNTGDAGKTSGSKTLTLSSSIKAGIYTVYFLLEDPADGNLNTIIAAQSVNFTVSTAACPTTVAPTTVAPTTLPPTTAPAIDVSVLINIIITVPRSLLSKAKQEIYTLLTWLFSSALQVSDTRISVKYFKIYKKLLSRKIAVLSLLADTPNPELDVIFEIKPIDDITSPYSAYRLSQLILQSSMNTTSLFAQSLMMHNITVSEKPTIDTDVPTDMPDDVPAEGGYKTSTIVLAAIIGVVIIVIVLTLLIVCIKKIINRFSYSRQQEHKTLEEDKAFGGSSGPTTELQDVVDSEGEIVRRKL